jgi:hypothetical protein
LRARWSVWSTAASASNRRRRAADGPIEAGIARNRTPALTTARKQPFRRHYLNGNAAKMR